MTQRDIYRQRLAEMDAASLLAECIARIRDYREDMDYARREGRLAGSHVEFFRFECESFCAETQQQGTYLTAWAAVTAERNSVRAGNAAALEELRAKTEKKDGEPK